MIALLIVAGWIACGIYSFGVGFAYFQRHWPELAERDYWRDAARIGLLSISGPAAAFAALIVCGGGFTHWFKFR